MQIVTCLAILSHYRLGRLSKLCFEVSNKRLAQHDKNMQGTAFLTVRMLREIYRKDILRLYRWYHAIDAANGCTAVINYILITLSCNSWCSTDIDLY